MVTSEPAVRLVRWLYQAGDLALPRKAASADAVRSWTRPPGMRPRSAPRRWTAQEDAVVLAADGSQAEIARLLGRTTQSVNLRAWRLRNSGGDALVAVGSTSVPAGPPH